MSIKTIKSIDYQNIRLFDDRIQEFNFEIQFSIFNLKLEFSSSPMSSFGVISNGVPGLHSDPLRDRTVLSLFFSQFSFYPKRLMSRLFIHLLAFESNEQNINHLNEYKP